MSLVKRHTTFSVRQCPEAERGTRKLPWGVFWNEYPAGHVGRPKQRSQWFATEAEALNARQVRIAAAVPTEGSTDVEPPVDSRLRTKDTVAAHAGYDPDPTKHTGWLLRVLTRKEHKTWRGYTSLVKNYIAPAKGHKRYPGLGTLVVADKNITTSVVMEFLDSLKAAGVDLSMRQRIRRVFSAFCTYAKTKNLLTGVNPCYGLGQEIRHIGELASLPNANPFSEAEIAQLFDYFAAVEPDYLPYFEFLYYTGVRPGEAAGLQWDRVNLDALKAVIAVSYCTSSRKDKLPKTHEQRTIDLNSAVADRLRAWRVVQRQELLRRGAKQTPYVFTSRRGGRFNPDSAVRDALARAMDACKIAGHRLYNFRCSFASYHLTRHWVERLQWVSHQLGHKHVSTTERHYYKYKPEAAHAGFTEEMVKNSAKGKGWGKSRRKAHT